MNDGEHVSDDSDRSHLVCPDDKPGEECGIFAIYNHPNAAEMTYLGLYALQHRGQESTGIVTADGADLFYHRGMGLVSEVFGDQAVFKYLKGRNAIGHNRYSTTGSNRIMNVQPMMRFEPVVE